jgi:hypothetical protein
MLSHHHGIARIACGAEHCAGHGHVLNMFSHVMFPPKTISLLNKLSVKRHLKNGGKSNGIPTQEIVNLTSNFFVGIKHMIKESVVAALVLL